MEIEKINDNEIRIIFNTLYLEENKISIHQFMSNSIESQQFFIDLLHKARKEIGFISDDSDLTIQTLYLSNGTFVITVTKNIVNTPENINEVYKNEISNYNIYKFQCVNDLNCFLNILKTYSISLDYSTYNFKNSIFLIFQNNANSSLSKIKSLLSEFAIKISNSDLLISKMKEYNLK